MTEKKSLLDKWEAKLGVSFIATFLFYVAVIICVLLIGAVIVLHLIGIIKFVVLAPLGGVALWKTAAMLGLVVVEGAAGLTISTMNETAEREENHENKAN